MQFTMHTARDQLAGDGKVPSDHTLAGIPVVALPYNRGRLEWGWTLLGSPKVDPWVDGADWIYTPMDRNVPTRRHRMAGTIHSLYPFDPECPGYHSWDFR